MCDHGSLLDPMDPNGVIPPAVRWGTWALQGFSWNPMCDHASLLDLMNPNGVIPPAVKWGIWALQGFSWNSMGDHGSLLDPKNPNGVIPPPSGGPLWRFKDPYGIPCECLLAELERIGYCILCARQARPGGLVEKCKNSGNSLCFQHGRCLRRGNGFRKR